MRKSNFTKKTAMMFFCVFTGIMLLLSGCGKTEKEAPKTVVRFLEDWDMPPAYHGNPYAPGGAGAVTDLIFGKMAIYVPITGKYMNLLAESVNIDGDKLTVKLKDGIKWHDGVPFTSKDVKGHFIFNGGWTGFPLVWDFLDSIETPDKNTVVFNLKKERSSIPEIFILNETIRTPYHIYEKYMKTAEELLKMRKENKDTQDNKEYVDKYNKFRQELLKFRPELPIGNGPYKVTAVTATDIILDRVDSFPGIENTDIDQLIISKAKTNEIKWSYLKNGDVDMIEVATPQDVTEDILKNNPEIEHLTPPYFAYIGLFMNIKREPFSELKFRQALAYIIDRDEAKKPAAYYGKTVDKNSGMLSSIKDKWIDDSKFNDYTQDWKKASELLEELGMKKNKAGFWCDKNGKELNFEIMGRGNHTDFNILCEEISRKLTKFGIKNQVRILENALFHSVLESGNFDMTIDFTFEARKHPLEGYRRMFGENQRGRKVSGFDVKVLDENGKPVDLGLLVEELEKITDVERQKEIYQTLAWATNYYLPVLDIFEKNAQFFINDGKRVRGWPEGDELLEGLSADKYGSTLVWILDGKLHKANDEN